MYLDVNVCKHNHDTGIITRVGQESKNTVFPIFPILSCVPMALTWLSNKNISISHLTKLPTIPVSILCFHFRKTGKPRIVRPVS